MASPNGNEEDNPYLALRAAKIARNEARLRDLGLMRDGTAGTRSALADRRSNSNNTTASGDKIQVAPTLPNPPVLRRSKRKANIEDMNSDCPRVASNERNDALRKRIRRPATVQSQSALSSSSSSICSSHSARSMEINVDKLLYGTAHHPGLLGCFMEQTGKAHVMQMSALRAVPSYGTLSSQSIAPISFNKYSGIQEWGNDAIFLWINLGSPDADVVNEFLQGGRQVTFYGGAKMHEGSAAIQKLLHVGSPGKEPSENQLNGVVLWVRRYHTKTKTFGPYACLGRLSLESYDPTSKPLAFVWNLLDNDKLRCIADPLLHDLFGARAIPRQSTF